jgi:hypothetical protein
MLDFLKGYFNFCSLAFTEIKPSRGGKLMKVIYSLALFILGTVIGGVLGIRYLDIIKLLPWYWWGIIILFTAIIFLLSIIEGARRFHEKTIEVLSDQHHAAKNLFHRNDDIIARLNYEDGKANEITITGGFDEQSANAWSSAISQYLAHYKLDDFIRRFSAPDHELLEVLPDALPSNPDELRRKRMEARRRLLSKFAYELRTQAINSPYGSDSDSKNLGLYRRADKG